MKKKRIKVLKKVLAGELPVEELSPEELFELEEAVMNLVIQKKLEEGKITFSGVECQTLN